jgi:hypothetical protein
MAGSWNKLLKNVYKIKSLDEAQALAEPSIMDEEIKKSDPEQYAKILQAQQLMGDLNAGMNYASPLAVGSIKAVPTAMMRAASAEERPFQKAANVVNEYFKGNDYFPLGEYEQSPQFIKSKFVKGTENTPITKSKIIKEVMDNPEYLSAMEESIKPLNKRYEATLLQDPRQRLLENISSWQDLIKLQAMRGTEPVSASAIKKRK